MFASAAADPRIDPPACGTERETLMGFLAYQRQTLEAKCAGLGPLALSARAVAPSTLSLLGLVRHLTDVERFWVRSNLLAQPDAPLYWHEDGKDSDFDHPPATTALVAASWEAWHDEMAFTDAALSQQPCEKCVVIPRHGEVSVRWIITHLIEEYSRHNGHADLLRECIDGVVGE